MLESLNGGAAAEGSDITLTHGKAGINVDGGDLGEYANISPGGELTLETRDGGSLIFAASE